MWYDFLKNLPQTVYRQKIIGNFIVDFYISSCKLVIELDGAQHTEPQAVEYDAQRTAYPQQARLPGAALRQQCSGHKFRGCL